jgi:hypothetical protein
LAAAWLNPLHLALRFGLSLAIAWSLWRSLNADSPIIGLRSVENGQTWRFDWANGAQTDAVLLGSSLSTVWFVLLHLRSDRGKRYHLLICRDSLEAEAFRRLRLALLGQAKNGKAAEG